METKQVQNYHIDLARLKALRIRAGLTQNQVSRILGYKSTLGYHYIESGRCRLRADQLLTLAQLYGVSIDSLIISNEAADHAQQSVS
ncbi:MAG: helix-turn-helix transcriptional regulator [Syntrophothermus sp.]|uniref:helix-turn-helix transcriptional regulator n=1 Tax=Syntrophothermus sp. TaxID=2736299 RepID=UPI002579F9FE|nr:helix-turn-helix transcriptional regulator [Syntrophothermus sp.]NSW84682.1 helix-turn-helix transcriptional regulator [Syntrophothermus sp.]